MGAIAAAVSKKGENVVPKVVVMLRELRHRGTDAHGVATPNMVAVSKSIKELLYEEIEASTALGHNLSRILVRDRPQPIQGEGYSFVFEGRLFPCPNRPEAEEVIGMLKPDPPRKAGQVIEGFNGSYAFAVACPNRVVAGRETMGTTPLYYGENEAICAIASERKALWALGIGNVESFPPGNLAVVNAMGFSFVPVKPIAQPPLEPLKMGIGTKRLLDLLLESTKDRVSDVERIAVAFSGGLDSSIVAVLAKMCGVNVQLISVGLEGQPEAQHVEAAAEVIGLPIHLQKYTMRDVREALPKVLWLMEELDAVKAGVAVPFYWTAETSSRLGCNILLAGQGSDELFGGYQRYMRQYAQSGISAVQTVMYRDVASSYETNFQRDNQVCSFHKVELRLPFADRHVTHFSLGLPLNLKIDSAEDFLRKKVLRRVARSLGIPDFIADRPKKAIQYGTGVDKALRMLAKEEGLTLRSMLSRVFREAYLNLEGSW